MSADALPIEMLRLIFTKLDVRSFVTCRQVCKHWMDIVDDSQECWQKFCEEDYSTVDKEARIKSGLSYKEFYKSLSLWTNVANSTMSIVQSNIRVFKYNFQILPNRIIACPLFGNMDTLYYYNMDTQKIVKRLKIGVFMLHFVETERMIVYVDMELMASVYLKATKRRTVLGYLRLDDMETSTKIVVLDEEIFFITMNNELHQSILVPDDEEIYKVVTTKICSFSHKILAAKRKDSYVHFLVPGGILYLKDNEPLRRCSLNRTQYKNVNTTLERSGFRWCDVDVYSYLHHFHRPIEELPQNITNFKSSLICSHGDIVMLATSRKFLHIFKTYLKPEKREGFDKICYRAKLLKTIDLKLLLPGRTHICAEFNRAVDQMEIVESENGHTIVVSYGGIVCFMDLYHSFDEGSSKRKASGSSGSGYPKRSLRNAKK